MIEELKAYKNSYGDIFETKEEAERQEKITRVKIELIEAKKTFDETISFIEREVNKGTMGYSFKHLEVKDLLETSSYRINDNENYRQTERIIELIRKIIDCERFLKRLESNFCKK